MKKDKEKHCVRALEWRPGGKRRSGRPKIMCRRMVEDESTEQLGGSHGPMSEPSQQTVVVGKRMSKPFVPYGIK